MISDIILDRNGPFPHDTGEPCNFGSRLVKNSYQTAHQITGCGKSRPLTTAELQRAMRLYVSVFNEIFGRIRHEKQEY